MGLNIEAAARARGLWREDGGGHPRQGDGRHCVIWCQDGIYWLRWWTLDAKARFAGWTATPKQRIGDDVGAALLVLLHDVEPWPVTCPRCRGDRDKPCDCDPKTRTVPGPAWSQVLLDAMPRPCPRCDGKGGTEQAGSSFAACRMCHGYETRLEHPHAREQLHALADWLSEQDRTCPACKRRSLPGRKLAKWLWAQKRYIPREPREWETSREWKPRQTVNWWSPYDINLGLLGWATRSLVMGSQIEIVSGSTMEWARRGQDVRTVASLPCPRCTVDGKPTGIDPAGPHALGEALAMWLDDPACCVCDGKGWTWPDAKPMWTKCELCNGTGREVVPRLRSILAALEVAP